MLKLNKYLLSMSLLALIGCAHVVVEERLVPFSTAWNGKVDMKNYNPRDISNTLDMGGLIYMYI